MTAAGWRRIAGKNEGGKGRCLLCEFLCGMAAIRKHSIVTCGCYRSAALVAGP